MRTGSPPVAIVIPGGATSRSAAATPARPASIFAYSAIAGSRPVCSSNVVLAAFVGVDLLALPL